VPSENRRLFEFVYGLRQWSTGCIGKINATSEVQLLLAIGSMERIVASLLQRGTCPLVFAFSSLEPPDNHVSEDKSDYRRGCKNHCRRNEEIE
jgi:hypothetical protein